MSIKRMFFRIIISELIFFGACILIFAAHLAFWLDDIGIAENFFNINLSPSSIPLYILGIIFLLAFTIFTAVLFKQIKRLQFHNFGHSQKAYLLSLGCLFLLFCVASLLWLSQDSNPMGTVIPGLMALYFAIKFIIQVMLYFALFLRTNKNTLRKII